MNHAKVHFKANIQPDRIHLALAELISAKWPDGAVVLKRVSQDDWHIESPLSEFFGMSVWIRSARTLEMRKGGGDVNGWLQAYIQENLASRFGGRCSNEGASGSWAPEPEKMATFKGFFYAIMDATGDRKAPVDGLWERMADGGLIEWAQKIVFKENGELR